MTGPKELGGYVNDPPYNEMRLKILLTGTSSPSDKVWVEALRNLMKFLESPDGAITLKSIQVTKHVSRDD